MRRFPHVTAISIMAERHRFLIDWGGGYGYTRYNEQTIGKDNTLGAQSVGTISALISGVSIRFSNDILGLTGEKHDRWRTNAVEIGYRNYVIGSYINTNDGSKESWDIVDYHGLPVQSLPVHRYRLRHQLLP